MEQQTHYDMSEDLPIGEKDKHENIYIKYMKWKSSYNYRATP